MMTDDDVHRSAEVLIDLVLNQRANEAHEILKAHGQDTAGRITDRIRRWGYTNVARELDLVRFP